MANSPTTPNRYAEKAALYPYWVHPDVKYMASEWELLRDCDLGEKQIKIKGQDYLPRMEAFTDPDYVAYLDRAVFYNMVSRTLGGMVGSIFRRLPNITNKPDKLDLSNVGQESEDFRTFTKTVAQEVIHMGRCGVLLDRASISTKDQPTLPYLTIYIAESILTWQTAMINGRKQLVKVVLREIIEDQDTATGYTRYLNQYRVLKLEQNEIGRWTYIQQVYRPTQTKVGGATAGPQLAGGNGPTQKKTKNQTAAQIASGNFNADSDGRTTGSDAGDANIYGEPDETLIPTIRGVPFDFIPFMFFGPSSNSVDVEKSPLLDIARLNISHYRSYAHLEHGRYFTGLPVYWTQVDQNDSGAEYTIGPSVVWEIPLNARAGIIEFNGSGLKYLADALSDKEAQVAALGGRLIGVSSRSVSESDNQVQVKDRNEQALLLSCTLGLDGGFTRLMRWFCDWIDIPTSESSYLTIEFNKDFLFSSVSAREFRAIEAMYLDGVIPIEIVFDYFKRAEVIPDWLDVEEFKALIHSAASFPDQPDFDAREEGYPDSGARVVSMDKELDRENAIELAQMAADTQQSITDTTVAAQQNLATTNAKNAQKTQAQQQAHQIKLEKVKARLAPKPGPTAPSQRAPATKQASLMRNQRLQQRETTSSRGTGAGKSTTQNFNVNVKVNGAGPTAENQTTIPKKK